MLLLTLMSAALVLASGVAVAVTETGGPGDNVLVGTNGRDFLDGGRGDDTIYGKGGNDRPLPFRFGLVGGFGDDTIDGGGGDDHIAGYELGRARDRGEDTMTGGSGRDVLDGGRGADTISGEGGPDLLMDGENKGGPTDTLDGGTGNDILAPRNEPAGRDIVDCGEGTDTAYVDRKDVLSDCERVRFRDARPNDIPPAFAFI
jgi:hypothetical protein